MGRSQAGGGSVMIWAMFCWETFAPAIYVDVTLTCNTNLKMADHVHALMETVLPDGVASFSRIMPQS